MNNALNLDRDVALKIALAARVLPDIGVGTLLEILHRRIPGDLTEESLKTITVTDLKTGFASVDGEEDGEDIGIGLPALKDAVRILWGEDDSSQVPEPECDIALAQLTVPDSIRVAIASNGTETLNGHFGSCIRFLIYQVSATQCKLVDVRSALEADFAEDKNAYRTDLIRDCQVLYVVSVGGPAAAKVVRAGVYPIKKIEGGEARAILADLQGVMGRTPPPWLAKILGVSAEDRIKINH